MKNKKKAIVLGGTHDHILLIVLLKKRGYHTVLIDYYENPPAKNYADEHLQESTLNKERVLELAQKIKPELVLAFCIDQALLTMAYVCEQLNLPCHISFATAQKLTNKVHMKELMAQNKIPTSQHIVVEGNKKIKEINLNYPVVVKPSDSNSSKGVSRSYTKKDLIRAVDLAFQESAEKKVVIEEFIPGEEFSADFMMIDGTANLLMASRNIKSGDSKSFTIHQNRYPATTDNQLLKKIEDIGKKIAEAHSIRTGPLLVQMIHNDGEIFVIEYSSRIGGGSKHQFVKFITGYDLIESFIDVIMGNRVKSRYVRKKVYACVNYLYSNKPGIVKEYNGFDAMIERGLIEEVYFYKTAGMDITGSSTSSDRWGGYMTYENSEEGLDKKIRIIDKELKSNEDIIQNIIHDYIT